MLHDGPISGGRGSPGGAPVPGGPARWDLGVDASSLAGEIERVFREKNYKNLRHFLSPAEREILSWTPDEARRGENANKYRTNATKVVKKLWTFLRDYLLVVHSPVAARPDFAEFQALLARVLFQPPRYLRDRRSAACARYYARFYVDTARDLPREFFEAF
ncbi:MAG: hypothetical protein ACTSU5_17795 [Promethearchaeota archaeon]